MELRRDASSCAHGRPGSALDRREGWRDRRVGWRGGNLSAPPPAGPRRGRRPDAPLPWGSRLRAEESGPSVFARARIRRSLRVHRGPGEPKNSGDPRKFGRHWRPFRRRARPTPGAAQRGRMARGRGGLGVLGHPGGGALAVGVRHGAGGQVGVRREEALEVRDALHADELRELVRVDHLRAASD